MGRKSKRSSTYISDKIINIEGYLDNENYFVTLTVCEECGYAQVSVYPESADTLECTSCGHMYPIRRKKMEYQVKMLDGSIKTFPTFEDAFEAADATEDKDVKIYAVDDDIKHLMCVFTQEGFFMRVDPEDGELIAINFLESFDQLFGPDDDNDDDDDDDWEDTDDDNDDPDEGNPPKPYTKRMTSKLTDPQINEFNGVSAYFMLMGAN